MSLITAEVRMETRSIVPYDRQRILPEAQRRRC